MYIAILEIICVQTYKSESFTNLSTKYAFSNHLINENADFDIK